MVKFLESGFDQTLTMSSRTGSHIADMGACHNFSLHWLRMILEKPRQRASERMDVLHKNAGGINIVLQQAFVSRWSSDAADCEHADAMILRLRGLEAKSAVINYEAFSQSRLRSETITRGGCGFVYSFWFSGSVQGASGGAHSIALYRTSSEKKEGFYSIFDPNFGEFMILPGKFSSWFTDFRKLYGPFTAHMLRPIYVVDKDKT
ncbi:MAG: YopT-type cysteine protease domain-containing protein [Endozoicomonas sp.]